MSFLCIKDTKKTFRYELTFRGGNVESLGFLINFVCRYRNYAWTTSFGQAVKCWNWRWILKCLFTFLCFAGLKRRMNCSAIFVMISPNLFWILKVPQSAFHNNVRKHNNKNDFIFNTNFNIWRTFQMTWSTQYLWNVPATYTQYHLIFLVLAVLIFGLIFSTSGP